MNIVTRQERQAAGPQQVLGMLADGGRLAQFGDQPSRRLFLQEQGQII
jgi:hypothetical protein